MKKITLLLLLITFIPSIAMAETTHVANTFPSLGRGIRPLGMGNAFLTMKGTDENVLFYNPAAIRDYSNEVMITTGFIPPAVELNYSSIQLTRDIFKFKDNLDKQTTDTGKIDEFKSFVDKHVGKFYGFETRLPIVGAHNRYFAVSLITDSRFDVSFRNRAFPNFEIKSQNLGGISLGSAIGLFEERLMIGAAVKVLYGVENEQIVTTSDILANSMDDFKWKNWKRGLGVGGDVGVKYEIPDFNQDWIDTLHPVIAATYQDIGNSRFYFMKKNGGPTNIPQSVSAGIGIHPLLGSIETSLMFDFRELNIKEDFLLKMNIGAEARFPKRYGLKPSLRAGMNQAYPTVGAGLEIWKLTWNVAFFGRELGETSRQKAGYRIANEFSWRF